MTGARFSVIIPAHNEAARLGACLEALAAQRLDDTQEWEVIVVANGCSDATAAIVREAMPLWQAAGRELRLIETEIGNKIVALNLGDAASTSALRLYLDADVVVGAGMLAALIELLDRPGPRYAGARLRVPRARSRLSRLYARFWTTLPFVADGVTGAGLFAVNAEGRARWGEFPPVISDDGFARLNFAPPERSCADVDYDWPISEGFQNLVRVRRRQDAGMRELAERFPALFANAHGDRPDGREIRRLAMADPLGFLAYVSVAMAVRLGPRAEGWARGR